MSGTKGREGTGLHCPNCGMLVEGSARYCPACRAPLEPVEPVDPDSDVAQATTNARTADADRALDDIRQSFHELFDVERAIGGGGMTRVYVAWDRRRDCRVALKILRPDFLGSVTWQRFRREIEITRALSHPAVMDLYDAGEFDSVAHADSTYSYFSLPYLEGTSLRRRLEDEGPLPVAESLRIAVAVAEGLEYAHARHVLHRDVKPENVYLASDGRVLITDFGVAKGMERATSMQLTAEGFILGTAAYLSPEAIRSEQVDERSDQYALACVVFEMLAGRPPFEGTSQEVLLAHLGTAPPNLQALRASVPSHVASAIGRALSKLKADRFASVAEFRLALQRPSETRVVGLWGPIPTEVADDLCFVIMPFGPHPGVQELYRDHVEPTVRSCGMRALRADSIFGHHEIIKDIWKLIGSARLLIADVTARNANVFYELGMAHAIGKDVIVITQSADDVPFDIRHLRYIQYEYTPRGVAEFEKRLRATIEAVRGVR